MPTVETIDNADTAGEAVTTQPFAVDADIDTVVSWVAIVDNGFDVDVDVVLGSNQDW